MPRISPSESVEFAIVTVLAGLLLGELTSEATRWSWSTLRAGLEMTLRAALLMTAFSALSVELRNPLALGWFLRHGLDSYSAALAVAFEPLTSMTQAIGRQTLFLLSPLKSVARGGADVAAGAAGKARSSLPSQ